MKELLKKVGWTQAEFARQISVNKDTVNSWCQGEVDSGAYRLAIKYLTLLVQVTK